MSATSPLLRFRPEIAALVGQQTFRVNSSNRGFIRLSSDSPLMRRMVESIHEDVCNNSDRAVR